MATMFFGQYLLGKGGHRSRSACSMRSIGSVDPTSACRNSQFSRGSSTAPRPTRSWCSTACRMRPSRSSSKQTGGLSPDQVRRLQSKQRSSWLRIGAALVEGGHLSEEEIADPSRRLPLVGRARPIRRSARRCAICPIPRRSARVSSSPFFTSPESPCVRSKLESVSVEPDVLAERSPEVLPADRRRRGLHHRSRSPAGARRRRSLEGCSVSRSKPGSETEADAVCEVINLIGGNACTRIEQLGRLLRPEPPVWSGIWRGRVRRRVRWFARWWFRRTRNSTFACSRRPTEGYELSHAAPRRPNSGRPSC